VETTFLKSDKIQEGRELTKWLERMTLAPLLMRCWIDFSPTCIGARISLRRGSRKNQITTGNQRFPDEELNDSENSKITTTGTT
jgi:hypothetical protein